jgi:hypothetical protein
MTIRDIGGNLVVYREKVSGLERLGIYGEALKTTGKSRPF